MKNIFASRGLTSPSTNQGVAFICFASILQAKVLKPVSKLTENHTQIEQIEKIRAWWGVYPMRQQKTNMETLGVVLNTSALLGESLEEKWIQDGAPKGGYCKTSK
jgi:hypothetical protein